MRPSEELRTKVKEFDELMKEFKTYGIHNLRVFGSVARGEDTEESDIDFAVDVVEGEDGTLPGLEYFDFADRLDKLFASRVHLTDYTVCPDYLIEEINKDGKNYAKI